MWYMALHVLPFLVGDTHMTTLPKSEHTLFIFLKCIYNAGSQIKYSLSGFMHFVIRITDEIKSHCYVERPCCFAADSGPMLFCPTILLCDQFWSDTVLYLILGRYGTNIFSMLPIFEGTLYCYVTLTPHKVQVISPWLILQC